MPFIDLPASVPGIRSLLIAYPETGKYLEMFAQQLLRGESSLTPAERELIAAMVSDANNCKFCKLSHAAASKNLMSEYEQNIVDEVILNQNVSALSEKMQALIELALSVRESGLNVKQEHIDAAKAAGADEKAIHDTVLIAAAFCMFNRYVDGLRTWTPDDPALYDQMGQRMAKQGYTG